MDSIRVYVNDVEVGYYKIEDTGVTFTWQAKLIGEINSFSTTTTKTVTLPLTNELKVQLKSPDVIDTTNSLSNREYFRIDITWNDTVAIKGYIKLQKVVILENDEYVELAIDPREKNWITQFKNFKLTELDFTTGVDQTHQLTYSNIVASESYLSTREYVYAPIDIAEVGRLQVLWVEYSSGNTDFYYSGEVISSSTFTATSYGFEESKLNRPNEIFTTVSDAFWNPRGIYKARITTIAIPFTYYNQYGYFYVSDKSPFYWELSDFYPLVRHQAIVKRCFNRIGYGVTIVDNSDYFNSKYNFTHNIEQLKKLEKIRANNDHFKLQVNKGGFNIICYANSTQYIVTPYFYHPQYGYKDNTKYTDTNSDDYTNVQNTTNMSRFTADESIVISLSAHYDLYHKASAYGAGEDYYIIIALRQYDSSNTLRRTIQTVTYHVDKTLRPIRDEYFVGDLGGIAYLAAGDYVQVVISVYSIWLSNLWVFDRCTFESMPIGIGNYKNKTIRLNEYLPDITAQEYIKELSFINNWEIYTNEKLKQVYIVREDYKRTGKQIDFKDKLNRAKPVELEEIGLQWPKKSYFNWKKDDNDWCIKFIEQVTKASLGTTYKPNELEIAARFGMGLITNLNTFTIEFQEFLNEVYAASLDKFDTSNRINFNTVEMKGEETWPHLPTWKRTDYEPRYLTVYFGETLETNGVNGVTSVVYSIEGNTNHTTYPRVEFGIPLHYGETTGLIKTKYAKRERAIRYGWIFRGRFNIDENDVNTFVETYEDNNFRGDYELQLKGVKKIGELLKVNDFSPATFDQTEIEFVIYRDDL